MRTIKVVSRKLKMVFEVPQRWLARRINRWHPAQLVLFSYLLAITIGTFLLMLPIATTAEQIDLIDALFTATSAICITGLVVVDTGTFFTTFGQMVILAMIQIGGLGIMTVSVIFFRLIGRQISFRERMAVQDVFTHTPRADIYQILRAVVLFTLLTELAGFVLFFILWSQEYPFGQAVYLSVFHAVSGFTNAGFSLFSNSMMAYRGNAFLNATLCGLIVLGGIGFPVVYDLYHTYFSRTKRRLKLLAQTKIVLITSGLLIVGGALLFYALESGNALLGLTPAEQVMASVFQSITCRSSGFNTLDISMLSESTLTMMLFLMFVGAAPASCGGGIRVTTLALISGFAWSRFRRERRVNFFKKSVPAETLTKGIVLILLAFAFIALMLFLLLVTAPLPVDNGDIPDNRFLRYLFETVSAFGTVGLSMGVTDELTLLGKLWLILMMLIGRIGILTIAYMVVGPTATHGIEYAEENIMVG